MSEWEQTPVIDDTVIDSLRDVEQQGPGGLLDQLIDVYRRDSVTLINALDEAVTAGDVERVTRTAHSLKSSSANLGVRRVADLCAELERYGRDGDLTGAAERAQWIRSELNTACEALLALRGGAS